jgi:hypothetical protein
MLVEALSKEWQYFSSGRRQSRLLLLGDKMIRHSDVSQLATAELERVMRGVQANLGLIAQHSTAHAPIQTQMPPWSSVAESTCRPDGQ